MRTGYNFVFPVLDEFVWRIWFSSPSFQHLLDVNSLKHLTRLTLQDRITKSLLHLHKKKKPPSISAQFQVIKKIFFLILLLIKRNESVCSYWYSKVKVICKIPNIIWFTWLKSHVRIVILERSNRWKKHQLPFFLILASLGSEYLKEELIYFLCEEKDSRKLALQPKYAFKH